MSYLLTIFYEAFLEFHSAMELDLKRKEKNNGVCEEVG